MNYICIECQKIYDNASCPPDMLCMDADCPGDGEGLILARDREPVIPLPTPTSDLGLAVLVMDASGSMQDPAFPASGNPITRRRLVAGAVSQAIFSLRQMHQSERAYVAIIMFDIRQELLMTKSVAQYLREYPDAAALTDKLMTEFDRFNGGTDITNALLFAKSLTDKFLSGKMEAFGTYSTLSHTQYSPHLNKTLDVPNVRVLVYTDGEHTAHLPLKNPFTDMSPDLLMGIYFGQQHDKGREDLENILGNCPIHHEKQLFVFDRPEKTPQLRGFFRMASGASGFCPVCLAPIEGRKSEIRTPDNPSNR
jgi:hypothetical protein